MANDLGLISDAIMADLPKNKSKRQITAKTIKNILVAANLIAIAADEPLNNIRAQTVTLQDCFDQLIDYFNACEI